LSALNVQCYAARVEKKYTSTTIISVHPLILLLLLLLCVVVRRGEIHDGTMVFIVLYKVTFTAETLILESAEIALIRNIPL